MTAKLPVARSDAALVYRGRLASLRTARSEDAATLFQWRNDLEAFHLMHLPEGVATVEEYQQHWDATIQRSIIMLIVSEPDCRPAGVVQAYDVNAADGWCFVLSYVTPEHRSQRLGLEATVGFWDYLFTKRSVRKIYMDIVESNLGWLRGVPGLEVGLLREEGRFRRHATYDGRTLDVVRLALYRDAWLAIRDYVLPLFRLGTGLPAPADQPPAQPVEQPAARPQSPRVDLVRRYLRHAREGVFDEIIAMLAEDVVFTTPLTGAVRGKRDLENLLRFRHRMLSKAIEASDALPPIAWHSPAEQGDEVTICGSAGAAQIDLTWAFDANNKMTAISIEAPPELMTAYLLSKDLPTE